MTLRFLHAPLPVTPAPCGRLKDDLLVASWEAPQGRGPGERPSGAGLCLAEEPRQEFASPAWTLECWITWPEGTLPLRKPAVVAEAAGDGWTWELGFDHAGALKLVWRAGEFLKVVAGELLVDSLRAGRWYHVAAVVDGGGYCELFLTEAGDPLARSSGGRQKFEPKGATPEGRAALSLGRRIASADASPIHIGSAAFHRRALGPAEFRSLGAAELPDGVRADGNLDYGNVGRVFALSKDTIVFTAGPKETTWYAFRVRGVKGRTLSFQHFPKSPMGIAVFVSEDAGRTWRHPSGGAWRSFEKPALWFTHTFASDEAIFAASPPVTVSMADEWLEGAAKRLGGRIHEVGKSREGRSLRVLEVGSPDAPMIYLQAGQHNMMERLGFFMITSAFEAAASDAGLMAKTRWLIMPLVNVDSLGVCREDGNLNRCWGKEDGPPTVRALAAFLRREADRTGGLVMADWHAGTVWRAHSILCETDRGFSDPAGYADSLHLKRESGYPDFEACLREEGIHYTVLNGYARSLTTLRQHGYFEDFVAALPGVKVPLCVELSAIAAETAEGTEPVSLENLREDGVRWYRAIRRFLLRQP